MDRAPPGHQFAPKISPGERPFRGGLGGVCFRTHPGEHGPFWSTNWPSSERNPGTPPLVLSIGHEAKGPRGPFIGPRGPLKGPRGFFWPVFGGFSPEIDPGTPLDGPGAPRTSICTKNQPRRPILRPFLKKTQKIKKKTKKIL